MHTGGDAGDSFCTAEAWSALDCSLGVWLALNIVSENLLNPVIIGFLTYIHFCFHFSEDLRRWFIQQEMDLLRFRFSILPKDKVQDFLKDSHLHFEAVSAYV